jgi:hypothetical protein
MNSTNTAVIVSREGTESLIMVFKLLFSFHPEKQAPVRLSSGLFNCSVENFPTFRHHLDCNNVQECEEGEDEGPHCLRCQGRQQAAVSSGHGGEQASCPFCPGGVESLHNSKCYSTEILHSQPDTFGEFLASASETCRNKGGRVVVIKSQRDQIGVAMAVRQSESDINTCMGTDRSPIV